MRAQNVLVVATVVCGLGSAAPGSAEDRPIDTQRSTVTVRVFKSGLFRAFADDHIIQAPVAEGSLDDSATPHVQVVIDARRMRVLDPGLSARDRQEVQSRMLGSEVLDVNRFPWISFHSVTIQPLDAGGWLVRGELELHGRIHTMMVTVLPEKSHYKGSATLRQSDFGIVPISIAGGAVKVKDEIRIDFDIAIAERLAAAAGETIRKAKSRDAPPAPSRWSPRSLRTLADAGRRYGLRLFLTLHSEA